MDDLQTDRATPQTQAQYPSNDHKDPDEEALDPFDAPPVPFRPVSIQREALRYRIRQATPHMPIHRPRIPSAPIIRPSVAIFDVEEEPTGLIDFRDTLPPLIPEGTFNPGVAVAWAVVAIASALAYAWLVGPAALLGL